MGFVVNGFLYVCLSVVFVLLVCCISLLVVVCYDWCWWCVFACGRWVCVYLYCYRVVLIVFLLFAVGGCLLVDCVAYFTIVWWWFSC